MAGEAWHQHPAIVSSTRSAALRAAMSTGSHTGQKEHCNGADVNHWVGPTGRIQGGDQPSQTTAATSLRERALSAASQAGLVNDLNDGLAWGIFPILFTRHGLTVGQVGVLAALYPAVWGAGQLVTGAASDRYGRKWLIAAGMWAQAAALALVAAGTTFATWALAALLADAFGLVTAIWAVAALTAASGVIVAVRMYETLRSRQHAATGTPC